VAFQRTSPQTARAETSRALNVEREASGRLSRRRWLRLEAGFPDRPGRRLRFEFHHRPSIPDHPELTPHGHYSKGEVCPTRSVNMPAVVGLRLILLLAEHRIYYKTYFKYSCVRSVFSNDPFGNGKRDLRCDQATWIRKAMVLAAFD
jgi:hypothetical protein